MNQICGGWVETGNNSALLSDNTPLRVHRLLNSHHDARMLHSMKKLMLHMIAALFLGTSGASAACYAEYKAKRDNPLELFYNVAQIGAPCTRASARAQLSALLASQGLTLLKVLSVSEQ